MTEILFIRPIKGLIVRDPVTKHVLPLAGLKVEKSSYWLRRLKEGSVTLQSESAPKPEPAQRSESKPLKDIKEKS